MIYLKIYMLIGLILWPLNIKCYLVNENIKLKDARFTDFFIWLFFIPMWIFGIKETFEGGNPEYRKIQDRLEKEKIESEIKWKKRRLENER